MIIVKCVVWS